MSQSDARTPCTRSLVEDTPSPSSPKSACHGRRIREFLRSTVAEMLDLPPSAVADDEPLADLGLDSMSAVVLLISIENEFDVSVPPERLRDTALDIDSATAVVTSLLEPRTGSR